MGSSSVVEKNSNENAVELASKAPWAEILVFRASVTKPRKLLLASLIVKSTDKFKGTGKAGPRNVEGE